MRQLVLKILFVVGSALIYIQCIKTFIGSDKMNNQQQGIKNNRSIIHSKSKKQTGTINSNILNIRKGLKTREFVCVSNNRKLL
jgi:hypothetical protein